MQWSAEANARLTTMFFSWLVGPMEIKAVEIERDGRTETWRSGVLIKKCRYLEQSGCVGMCTNMCKVGCFGPTFPAMKPVSCCGHSYCLCTCLKHQLAKVM